MANTPSSQNRLRHRSLGHNGNVNVADFVKPLEDHDHDHVNNLFSDSGADFEVSSEFFDNSKPIPQGQEEVIDVPKVLTKEYPPEPSVDPSIIEYPTSSSSSLFQNKNDPTNINIDRSNDNNDPDSSALEEAPWSTRATILFLQGLVLTALVGIFMIMCMRKHIKRSRRVERLRANMASMRREELARVVQEWTTIRPNAGEVVPALHDAHGVSYPASSHPIEIVDVGANQQNRTTHDLESGGDQNQNVNESNNQPQPSSPTSFSSLSNHLHQIPRTILAILSYPLHALDRAVNSWSTERARTNNYDAHYFQSVVERIQEEAEARKENPQEREARLKEAFVKGKMVWEVGADCFLPPLVMMMEEEEEEEEETKECVNKSCGLGDKTGSCDDNNQCASGVGDMASVCKNNPIEERANAESEGEISIKASSSPNANEISSAAVGIDKTRADNDDKEDVSPHINNKRNDDDHGDRSDNNNGNNSLGHADNGTLCEERGQTPEHEGNTISPLIAAPYDTDSSHEYLYLPVSNRPRNRTMSEPSAQAILAYSQSMESMSSSESATSMPFTSNVSATSSLPPLAMEEEEEESPLVESRLPVLNQCAICLCDYEPGDTIVISSSSPLHSGDDDNNEGNANGDSDDTNTDNNISSRRGCNHAFHQECIVEWLVKMQEGTPCPCCRQTFVDLDEYIPGVGNGNTANRARAASDNTNMTVNTSMNNSSNNSQNAAELERLRREQRRRSIELGIQRGGRAFDVSRITFRSATSSTDQNSTSLSAEEWEQIRMERRMRNIELGIQRGGRAFDVSRISIR